MTGLSKAQKSLAIDGRTHLEAAFRIIKTEASKKAVRSIKTPVEEIHWGPSSVNPNGLDLYGFYTPFINGELVRVPHDLENCLESSQGFLMLKVVTMLGNKKSPYFVAPTKYGNKVYRMDDLDPIREKDGVDRFVYSIPFHKMEYSKPQFFFVVTMKEVPAKPHLVAMRINKITVIKGRKHFTVREEEKLFKYYPLKDFPTLIAVNHKLDNLGLPEIFERYQALANEGEILG